MATIRLATPADISSIACLANRNTAWIDAIRSQLVRGQLAIFIAGPGATPTGYAIFQLRHISLGRAQGWRRYLAAIRPIRAMANSTSLLQPMRIAMAQGVFVQPEYRRRGIGTALMARGIAHVQTRGMDDIRVHLATADAGLEPFYRHLGFLPIQVYFTKSLTADALSSPPCGTASSRPATQRDAAPLAVLLRDAIHHQAALADAFRLRPDIDWQVYSAAKLAHPDVHLRVVEQDGQIVAFVELRLIRSSNRLGLRALAPLRCWRLPPASPPPYGIVQDIYISPPLRRRGLASILLQDAHCWFNARGATHVRAAIWQANHGSFQLFQEAGYQMDEWVLQRR